MLTKIIPTILAAFCWLASPTVWVAIVAPIISVTSLIVAITSCVIAARSYKKSKRLEFFQRRDQLFLRISDLNAKNSEAHLISARYGIVVLNRVSLVGDEQFEKENKTQIAALKKIQEDISLIANRWDETIKQLHSVCTSVRLDTDATRIENLIAMVQVASDEAKRSNEVSLSSLHTLETVNLILRAHLAEASELEIRRAQLERAIREIKPDQEQPS